MPPQSLTINKKSKKIFYINFLLINFSLKTKRIKRNPRKFWISWKIKFWFFAPFCYLLVYSTTTASVETVFSFTSSPLNTGVPVTKTFAAL